MDFVLSFSDSVVSASEEEVDTLLDVLPAVEFAAAKVERLSPLYLDLDLEKTSSYY